MEKIKRIFLPLAVVLILLPVLVSCDDDEPYYSPLVGTWGVTSESNIYHEFEFYSDGIVTSVNDFLRTLDSLYNTAFNKFTDNERFVKLCCHILWNTTFVHLKFRTYDDNGTC